MNTWGNLCNHRQRFLRCYIKSMIHKNKNVGRLDLLKITFSVFRKALLRKWKGLRLGENIYKTHIQ